MWLRVDDRFHASRKVKQIPRGKRMAALGLWISAGSWTAGEVLDGFVPEYMVDDLGGTKDQARALVAAGLWEEVEGGWKFIKWTEYNPDAGSIKAEREAKSVGGTAGNHRRWHVKRGLRVAGCEFCESDNRSVTDSLMRNPPDSEANPPDPTRPDPSPPTSYEVGLSTSDADASDDPEFSADVERLCQTLSQLVRANGHKGNVTKQWRVECDRLIRIDEFAPQQIEWVMRWACNDSFWLPNIQSMPKLRQKFTQLKAKALQEHQERTGGRAPTRTEQNLSVVQRLAAQEAEEARLEINA